MVIEEYMMVNDDEELTMVVVDEVMVMIDGYG